jgi:hypothetical protein
VSVHVAVAIAWMHDHTMTIIESKAVGQGLTNILFVRDDGLFAVAHIENGGVAMTQSGDNAAKDWTHVVAIDSNVLFVRDDGLFAVAHIENGGVAMTQSGDNAAKDWTHILAVA